MEPLTIQALNLTSTHNLVTQKFTIDDHINPNKVYFLLNPKWGQNDDKLPLYINLAANYGISEAKFILKLTETGTNKVIFQNKSSKQKVTNSGSILQYWSIACDVSNDKVYTLEVSYTKPSKRFKHWYSINWIYNPSFVLKVGPFIKGALVDENLIK